jgi:hypothetical protein
MANKVLYENLLLFRGALTEVSQKSNFPLDSVRRIIRDGKWDNPEVIKIAESVLRKRKKKMEMQLCQIN